MPTSPGQPRAPLFLRPFLSDPSPEPTEKSLSPASTSSSHASKPSARRRDMTVAACTNCRRRKVKCDGRRPACSSCHDVGLECGWTTPEGFTEREAKKRNSEKLRDIISSTMQYLLRLYDGTDDDVAAMVRTIRNCSTLDDAAELITGMKGIHNFLGLSNATGTRKRRVSEPAPGRTDSPCKPSSSPNETLLSKQSSTPLFSLTYQPLICHHAVASHAREPIALRRSCNDRATSEIVPSTVPVASWTKIKTEAGYARHIVALLMSWSRGTNCFIDWEMLLRDMEDNKSNKTSFDNAPFCSPVLVNALLAWGSLFSTRDQAFTHAGDLLSRGQRFAKEAFYILESRPLTPSPSNLQALSILSEYESVVGDPVRSTELLRASHTMYSQLNSFANNIRDTATEGCGIGKGERIERAERATSMILWGYYVRESKLSVLFGRRMRVSEPRIPEYFRHEPDPKAADSKDTSCRWSPYPSASKPGQAFSRDVFVAEVDLAKIAEKVLEATTPMEDIARRPEDSQPLDVSRNLRLYNWLLSWKAGLPDQIQLPNSILPSVLLLHVTFDCLVIQVLRPLCRVSNWRVVATGSCHEHAARIMSILWTYRSLYTLAHEYSAIQGCLSAALATMFDRELGSVQTDTFMMACKALHEISANWPLAGYMLQGIKALAQKHQSRITVTAKSLLYSVEEPPRMKELAASFGHARVPAITSDNVNVGGPEGMTGDAYGQPFSTIIMDAFVYVRAENDLANAGSF